MGDAQLVEQVNAILEQNPYVPHRNLRFEARQGHVTLRGVVVSYFQKQMAQEALRAVDGIEHIENQLEVRCS